MTQETQKILDKMLESYNQNKLKPGVFFMHQKTKEEKQIPDSYKGIDVFVSMLMPIDSIYLTEQTCLWE